MGSVLATDTNTRFLATLDYPWLEVRTHNVITDPLPAAEFDLVHTRLVLTHLPERERVLEKMAKAVKVGRWLLVEEPDFTIESIAPGIDEDLIPGPRACESLASFNGSVGWTSLLACGHGTRFGIHVSSE
jgi:trans-aconitate methyltransferase